MMMHGKNITAANDQMLKILDEDLYKLVAISDAELKSRIHQLRTLATIDLKKYRQMKTCLPYVCCGIFTPPIRKTENFASINTFILDIDHLAEKDFTVDGLKSVLKFDPRIFLMFVSPGNQGLKLLFRLKEKCYDAAQFSLFYKLFARDFSLKYGLQQVIDLRTCDVTRACFISHDPDCYFNRDAELVRMDAFIDFSNTAEVIEIQKDLKDFEKEFEHSDANDVQDELSPDILQQIKMKLNPNIRTQKQKNIYVPEELEQIIQLLTDRLKEKGIEVRVIENIHYGKKFNIVLNNYWAELNVFYGKKGFSVVKTPKRGSNDDLAEIALKIFCQELFN